jgi:hypothetical protein
VPRAHDALLPFDDALLPALTYNSSSDRMIERGAGADCRQSIEGASARVETERDHDTIGAPAWHINNASNVLCLFSFAHFSGLNAVTMYLVALLDVVLLIH